MNENEEIIITAQTEEPKSDSIAEKEREAEALTRRIEALRKEENAVLQEKEKRERFMSLFPNASWGELSEETRSSEHPEYYYAFCLWKAQRDKAETEAKNREMEKLSEGGITLPGEATYSMEDVKRMSRNQVHDHFREVKKSMKFWKK